MGSSTGRWRVPLRHAASLLVTFLVLVGTARPSAAFDWCTIEVDYQGISTVHVSYQTIGGLPVGARLEVRRGDSTTKLKDLAGAASTFQDRLALPLTAQRYMVVADRLVNGTLTRDEGCAVEITLTNEVSGIPTGDDAIEGEKHGSRSYDSANSS